jgi:hypothetical protein
MGHHARTLTAVIVVLAAALVAVSSAAAEPYVVRAETRDMNSIATGAFLPRTAVEATAVTITDEALTQPPATCPATSPVAALVAAFGPTQVKTLYTGGRWVVSKLKGYGPTFPAPPGTMPPWYWRIYVDQHSMDGGAGWAAGDVCAPPPYSAGGSEVLAYQACGSIPGPTTQCYSASPLYMRIRDGGPYDLAPQTVPGRGAPVATKVFNDDPQIGTPSAALLGTDESTFTPVKVPAAPSPLQGQGAYSFTEYGPHQVIAVAENGSRPPARMAVCVSEGNDGFCGSTKVQPPPEIPYDPSPCTTNGHDGFCGTIDTSGPITHVTNITQKRVFKPRKGPGQVKGTIETDPNGVQDVKLRLTRVLSVRVKVKAKKKKGSRKKPKARYKTVKRCSAWSDQTALLVTMKKCGAKYAKWWTADLSDLRNEFSYSFAMTLPRGTYTLEVLAADEDGHKDAPEPGRNVLTFTVR